MLKKELRQEIRARKRQFSEAQLRELSLSVLLRMLDNQHVKEADTILMYYSLPDEVFTHEVINTLVEEGKTVLLPVVLNGEDMVLRLYRGAEDLKTGSFGIMEPVGKPFPCYSEIDVAIIPGMSFDNDGNRLGRGKGYYDRLLAKIPQTYKIGMCFDFQKTDKVPTEETDIRMDEVL